MGRPVEIVPVIDHSLSVSLNALLSRQISDGRSDEISYSVLMHRTGPHHTQPKYPSTTFIVLCQSKSNISSNSSYCQPYPKYFRQCRYPSSADFLPLSQPAVIPGHTRRHSIDPGSSAWTHLHLIHTWPEWAPPPVKVSTSSMRSDLPARPSAQAPACSLYHSLVRTGQAEIKYIADYPADAGSLTRLHGSSGQGGYTHISQKKRICP